MPAAILYLPDAASGHLATRLVAGRSLVFRAALAAARAGASLVGIPRSLRCARVDREIRRAPETARAVRWLDGAVPAPGFAAGPCVLVPASALAEAPGLRAFIARGGGANAAILDGTAAGRAPVLAAPAALVGTLWPLLAAGQPLGEELTRWAECAARVGPATSRSASRVAVHPPTRPPIGVTTEADLTRAEARLYESLGTENDTRVDRYLHRRCSLPLTRALVRTPATPNQVSLASLAVGAGSVWCMWHATEGSAALGVVLYAAASIIDHCDGELARLTAQESRLGAHLDWAVDTLIHSGLALAMGVSAGGPALGALGASGVAISAALARLLPREIEVGRSLGGVLRHLGNRDLFYLVLLAFALLRGLAPALLPGLAALVGLGSHGYWIACLSRIRRAARLAEAPE